MTAVANKTLMVKSPSFTDDGFIPSKYTCDGININPELTLKNIPEEAKSLVVIVEDPEAPSGTFDHWVMWNIPVKNKIEENSAPGVQGKNERGENKYSGPCPTSGTHHYHFKVYALDRRLELLPEDTNKNRLLRKMEGHILAFGQVIGKFKRD